MKFALVFGMSNQAQALVHLQEYARNIKEKLYNVDSHGDEQAYETRLNKSLAHLKDQVNREQSALQTVTNSIQFMRERIEL